MANLQGRGSASLAPLASLTTSTRGPAAAAVEAAPEGRVHVFNKVLFLIDISDLRDGWTQEVRETVATIVNGMDRLSEFCSTQWSYKFICPQLCSGRHIFQFPDLHHTDEGDTNATCLPSQETAELQYSSTRDTSKGSHWNRLGVELNVIDEKASESVTATSSHKTSCKAVMGALDVLLRAIRDRREKEAGKAGADVDANAQTEVDDEIRDHSRAKFPHGDDCKKNGTRKSISKELPPLPASPGLSVCQEGPMQQAQTNGPQKGELIVLLAPKPVGQSALSFINGGDHVEAVAKLRRELGVRIAWLDCRGPLRISKNPQADPEAQQSLKSAISSVICSKGTIVKGNMCRRRDGLAWLLTSGNGDKSRYLQALNDKKSVWPRDAQRTAATKRLNMRSVREGELPAEIVPDRQPKPSMFKGLCEGMDDTDLRSCGKSGRTGSKMRAGSQSTRPSSADISARVDGSGFLRQRLPQQQRAQQMKRDKKSGGGASGEVRSAATDAKFLPIAKNKAMASRGNRIVNLANQKAQDQAEHIPPRPLQAVGPVAAKVTAAPILDARALAAAPPPSLAEIPVVMAGLTPPSHLKGGTETVAQKAIDKIQHLRTACAVLTVSDLSVKIKDAVWEAVRSLEHLKKSYAPDSGPREILRDSLLMPVKDVRACIESTLPKNTLFITKMEVLLRLHILAVAIPGSSKIPDPADPKKPRKDATVKEVKELLDIYQMIASLAQDTTNMATLHYFYEDVLLKDFGVPLKKTIGFLSDKFDFEEKSLSPFNREAKINTAGDAAVSSKAVAASEVEMAVPKAAVPKAAGGRAVGKAGTRHTYTDGRAGKASKAKAGVTKHRPNGGRQGVSKASKKDSTKQNPNSLKSLSRNLFSSSPIKESKALADGRQQKATKPAKAAAHDPEVDKVVLGTPPLLGRAGKGLDGGMGLGATDGVSNHGPGDNSPCTSDSEVVPDTLMKPKGGRENRKPVMKNSFAALLDSCNAAGLLNSTVEPDAKAQKAKVVRRASKPGAWMVPASQQDVPGAGEVDVAGKTAEATIAKNQPESPSSSEGSPLQMRVQAVGDVIPELSSASLSAGPPEPMTGPVIAIKPEAPAEPPAEPIDTIAVAHVSVGAAPGGQQAQQSRAPDSVHLAVPRVSAQQTRRNRSGADMTEEGASAERSTIRGKCMKCPKRKATACRRCSNCQGMICYNHFKQACAGQKPEPQWRSEQPFLCLECSVLGSIRPAVQAGLADATPGKLPHQVTVNQVLVLPVYNKAEGLLPNLFFANQRPTIKTDNWKTAELSKASGERPVRTAEEQTELAAPGQPATPIEPPAGQQLLLERKEDNAVATPDEGEATVAPAALQDPTAQTAPETAVTGQAQAAVQPKTGITTPPAAPKSHQFVAFREARAYARQLGLASECDYQQAAANVCWPPEMPCDPDTAYRQKWRGWEDFLMARPANARAPKTAKRANRPAPEPAAEPSPAPAPDQAGGEGGASTAKMTPAALATPAAHNELQTVLDSATPEPGTAETEAEACPRRITRTAAAKGTPPQDPLPTGAPAVAQHKRSSARISSVAPSPEAPAEPAEAEADTRVKRATRATVAEALPEPQATLPPAVAAAEVQSRRPTRATVAEASPEPRAQQPASMQPRRPSVRSSCAPPAPDAQAEPTPTPSPTEEKTVTPAKTATRATRGTAAEVSPEPRAPQAAPAQTRRASVRNSGAPPSAGEPAEPTSTPTPAEAAAPPRMTTRATTAKVLPEPKAAQATLTPQEAGATVQPKRTTRGSIAEALPGPQAPPAQIRRPSVRFSGASFAPDAPVEPTSTPAPTETGTVTPAKRATMATRGTAAEALPEQKAPQAASAPAVATIKVRSKRTTRGTAPEVLPEPHAPQTAPATAVAIVEVQPKRTTRGSAAEALPEPQAPQAAQAQTSRQSVRFSGAAFAPGAPAEPTATPAPAGEETATPAKRTTRATATATEPSSLPATASEEDVAPCQHSPDASEVSQLSRGDECEVTAAAVAEVMFHETGASPSDSDQPSTTESPARQTTELKPTQPLLNDRFWSFDDARRFIYPLGFTTYTDWRKWLYKDKKRPAYIPAAPHTVYAKLGWRSWQHFFGAEGSLAATPRHRPVVTGGKRRSEGCPPLQTAPASKRRRDSIAAKSEVGGQQLETPRHLGPVRQTRSKHLPQAVKTENDMHQNGRALRAAQRASVAAGSVRQKTLKSDEGDPRGQTSSQRNRTSLPEEATPARFPAKRRRAAHTSAAGCNSATPKRSKRPSAAADDLSPSSVNTKLEARPSSSDPRASSDQESSGNAEPSQFDNSVQRQQGDSPSTPFLVQFLAVGGKCCVNLAGSGYGVPAYAASAVGGVRAVETDSFMRLDNEPAPPSFASLHCDKARSPSSNQLEQCNADRSDPMPVSSALEPPHKMDGRRDSPSQSGSVMFKWMDFLSRPLKRMSFISNHSPASTDIPVATPVSVPAADSIE